MKGLLLFRLNNMITLEVGVYQLQDRSPPELTPTCVFESQYTQMSSRKAPPKSTSGRYLCQGSEITPEPDWANPRYSALHSEFTALQSWKSSGSSAGWKRRRAICCGSSDYLLGLPVTTTQDLAVEKRQLFQVCQQQRAHLCWKLLTQSRGPDNLSFSFAPN